MNETIKVDVDFFEHLLNCLANQKFIKDINADALLVDYKTAQERAQTAIDEAYLRGRHLLLEEPEPDSEV